MDNKMYNLQNWYDQKQRDNKQDRNHFELDKTKFGGNDQFGQKIKHCQEAPHFEKYETIVQQDHGKNPFEFQPSPYPNKIHVAA